MSNPTTIDTAPFTFAGRRRGRRPPTDFPEAPALAGTLVGGRYRLTRLMRAGGMGAVYEGVQLGLGRRVAVKVLVRELAADRQAVARFRREAEVTAGIGHPHVVQLFDFGALPSGVPFLVMEYLDGEDLDQRLQRTGRLSARAVVHIVAQVASALDAVHAKGIVHRDLKPANLFVVRAHGKLDFMKVLDFGISKVVAAATRITAPTEVLGTPTYMAPEQATGQVDDVDHRSDQWALACIAHELLAGRPPFAGDNVASLLYQVIHQDPPALADAVLGVSEAMEAVLRRALSKRRTDRYPTMTAFARALQAALHQRAEPPSLRAARTGRALRASK